MMKYLLILSLTFKLYASISIPPDTSQVLLVSSKGFNSTQASLQAYERSGNEWKEVLKRPITVNLGRNGLAWGKGLIELVHAQDEPVKVEGDGKSPAGLFRLGMLFGYKDNSFDLPYLQVDKNTLCIDDSDSLYYNQIIQEKDSGQFKSFEFMRREDILYKLGIIVGHNQENLKKRGSCIFVHIQKGEKSPTAGCTSLQEEQLFKIMQWLKKESFPLLLQLPDSYLQEGFK
jgi:D-alanyl-D-alanine dipeptidase